MRVLLYNIESTCPKLNSNLVSLDVRLLLETRPFQFHFRLEVLETGRNLVVARHALTCAQDTGETSLVTSVFLLGVQNCMETPLASLNLYLV